MNDDEEFHVNDVIVMIGRFVKWRMLEIRPDNYRVEEVCDTGRCVTTFDRTWVDSNFVKVGVFHWFYGERVDGK